MDFVPEPLVGRVVVAMRADYQYGPPDPIQWPQVLSESFEYLCAVLRRVPDNDRRAPIWTDPQEAPGRGPSKRVCEDLSLFTNPAAHSYLGGWHSIWT